ncbi:hypothetical protein [Paenibacillus odorifer]|uniref:hypothetical protein n=1 Tax=Paenibacillus odorifer TaxID=189426 RepID=UPI0015C38229|nr:hypothetical protein [Paenibacillus odorifer]
MIRKIEIIQKEKLVILVDVFPKGSNTAHLMSFRAIVDWQPTSIFYQTLLGLGVIPKKGAGLDIYYLANLEVVVDIQEHKDDPKNLMYSIFSISMHASLQVAL